MLEGREIPLDVIYIKMKKGWPSPFFRTQWLLNDRYTFRDNTVCWTKAVLVKLFDRGNIIDILVEVFLQIDFYHI